MSEFRLPAGLEVVDYHGFFADAVELQPWAQTFLALATRAFAAGQHGDLPRWLQSLAALRDLPSGRLAAAQDTVSIGRADDCDTATRQRLHDALRALMPWRKGPYEIFGIPIDTEWRSDWKWQRLLPHIQPLHGRLVLDVGCGNGYHCWRMLGAGARRVLGIDPTLLFACQFHALRLLTEPQPLTVLPCKSEQLPVTGVFDSVFSMGVLYHRRDPLEHLRELKNALRGDGELVLESLVIDGDRDDVLTPRDRYAKMNNVRAIPSCLALEQWLRQAGFSDIALRDVNRTSLQEQRRTAWMTFESLADFLDPADTGRTIEGYPAPTRALWTARRP